MDLENPNSSDIKKNNNRKKWSIITFAFVSTLASLTSVAYYVASKHMSNPSACENNMSEWTPCTESMCPSTITLDPSVFLYRNASRKDCDKEYKPIEFPKPYYFLQESLCPEGNEVHSEDDCIGVAKSMLNKEGAYRTNNANAPKCYYNTVTRSVHYNPYDESTNMNPYYLAICKNQSST